MIEIEDSDEEVISDDEDDITVSGCQGVLRSLPQGSSGA